MNSAGPVGSHCRKEVGSFNAVDDVFELLAVAGEENGTGSGSVSDPNNIALYVWGSIWRSVKRLIVPPVAGGGVCC